jgi:hypothetical protein
MTVQSRRSWRVPAARAGLGRRVFVPLVTAAAAVALCANAAGAAPRTASAAAINPNYLWGVSCADASHCFAVGQHTKPLGQPVAGIDQLSGGTWAPVPSPEPPGSASAALSGVACTGARSCLAVGTYTTSSGKSFPFAQRWNGTAWSLISVPAAGSTSSSLDSIACASARSCWAIGSDRHGTLAEHWNGSTWAIVASPAAGTSRFYPQAGVSCPAASNCWAVWSWYSASGSHYGTLTAHWNGTAWSKVATPTSGDSRSMLNGVSCSGVSACMAVGHGPKGGLAQRWNGSAWSLTLDGAPAATWGLMGIWCSGDSACMAVGFQSTGPNSAVDLAARWNGTAWSQLTTPNPADEGDVHGLQGIACITASDCWAAGGSASTGDPGFGRRIIEHWNGTKWSLVH